MTNKPTAEQLARGPVKVTSPEEIEATGLRRLAATDGTDAMLAVVIKRITQPELLPDGQDSEEKETGEELDQGSIESSPLEDDLNLGLVDGPTRRDILEIHERLDRIEKMIAELSLTSVRG